VAKAWRQGIGTTTLKPDDPDADSTDKSAAGGDKTNLLALWIVLVLILLLLLLWACCKKRWEDKEVIDSTELESIGGMAAGQTPTSRYGVRLFCGATIIPHFNPYTHTDASLTRTSRTLILTLTHNP
jgi:hypothetical protein